MGKITSSALFSIAIAIFFIFVLFEIFYPNIRDYMSLISGSLWVFTFCIGIGKYINSRYLFCWDDIPANPSELIDFLIQNYNANWVSKEYIRKDSDNNSIDISEGKNSLSFRLNGDKTKVNLICNVVRTDEFTVKKENDKLKLYSNNIFNNFLKKSIETKFFLLALIIFITGITIYIIYISNDNNENINELQCIFPQVAKIPSVGSAYDSSSGYAISQFNYDASHEIECYTEITFNTDNKSPSHAAWLIYPLKSYSASEFTHLSFKVKGEKGGEKFGIRIKDVNGRGAGVEVMEYITNKAVSTEWQDAKIPLNKFQPFNQGSIDVIALYVDDTMLKDNQETIYISKFRLYR